RHFAEPPLAPRFTALVVRCLEERERAPVVVPRLLIIIEQMRHFAEPPLAGRFTALVLRCLEERERAPAVVPRLLIIIDQAPPSPFPNHPLSSPLRRAPTRTTPYRLCPALPGRAGARARSGPAPVCTDSLIDPTKLIQRSQTSEAERLENVLAPLSGEIDGL